MNPPFQFWLGTHQPDWLRRVAVGLFISRVRLERLRGRYPTAVCDWALDSGAFTEVSRHGRWTVSEQQYGDFVRRCAEEIGRLRWAAPMDWMCEPPILQKTGKTVLEHQSLTIRSFLILRDMDLPVEVVPVLQGWTVGNYLDHVEQYQKAGVDLSRSSVVGVGSICRRQSSTRIAQLLMLLQSEGLRLHGFGVKLQGLALSSPYLTSADSLAWSFDARRSDPLPGHECAHKNCANCLEWALLWREKALLAASRGRLPDPPPKLPERSEK